MSSSFAGLVLMRRRALCLAGQALTALVLIALLWPLGPGVGDEQGQAENSPHKGRIEGVVSGPDGKAEPTRVQLQQYTLGGKASTASADGSGRFKATGLPYGRYWLTIRGDLVGDVELTPSQPAALVRLQAPSWSVLRGTVRDREKEKPVPGALIVLDLSSTDPENWKHRQVGNRYEWAHSSVSDLIHRARKELTPFALTDDQGRYELKLGDERGTLFAIPPNKDLFPEGRLLPGRVRGVSEQDFVLDRTEEFFIRGRVALADGKPFTNRPIQVCTRRHPDRVYNLTTDARGEYRFLPSSYLTGTAWLNVVGYAPVHQYVALDQGPPFPRVDWILRPPQTGKVILSVVRAEARTPVPDGFKIGYMRAEAPQPDSPKDGALVRTSTTAGKPTGEDDPATPSRPATARRSWNWNRELTRSRCIPHY